jgi:hypothetical protein
MYPADAEFINRDITNFLALYMLFGGGVLPGWRKRRRRTRGPVPSNQAASDAGSSRGRAPSGHPPNVTAACDDDDDDFMPMPPPRAPLSPENSADEVQPDPHLAAIPPVTRMRNISASEFYSLHRKYY